MHKRLAVYFSLLCFPIPVAALQAILPYNLSVDFASPSARKPLSGFLASFDLFSPPDSKVSVLRPALWRTAALRPEIRYRMQTMGARVEFMLSNGHTAKDNWGGLGQPDANNFGNFSAWENYITSTVQNMAGFNLLWDVWNEPDHKVNWSSDATAFYEMYHRVYDVLRRSLGPSAMIGGPSISRYDKTYLTNFLDYCLQAGVQVNFLSWHELDEADPAIPTVADHLSEARSLFFNNPKYAPLNIQEIQINESVGHANQYSPGAIAGYLYYMEKGGADAATKACWPDLAGTAINCSNTSVDGLFAADATPRAPWWVYKAYADGAQSRVSSTSSDLRIVALASTRGESPAQAQVLIGYLDFVSSPRTAQATVTMSNLAALSQFSQASSVHVKVERIPNSLEQSLPSLPVMMDNDVPMSGGAIQVSLSPIMVNEAYRITISQSATAPILLSDVSGASFSSAAVAPDSIVSAFGTNLAAGTASTVTAALSSSLANTAVTITDSTGAQRTAPLFFVSPKQVNYLLPPETAPGPATVTITGANGSSTMATLQVAPMSPGLFSANGNGQGVAAANLLRIRADGSRSFEPVAQLDQASGQYVPVPINLGPSSDQLYLSFYATGVRGRAANSVISVAMNDQRIVPDYAGPQGQFSGLDQVNVRLPRTLDHRTINVVLVVDQKTSNSVQIVTQ